MKTKFFQFYYPSRSHFKRIWEKGTIILDANALLDLYRISADSASKFLITLEKAKEKLWLPNQVGLEFSRGRLKVVSGLMSPFEAIDGVLDKSIRQVKKLLEDYDDHPFLDFEEVGELMEEVEAARDEIQKQKPKWKTEDEILKRVNKIFKGRIGDSLSDEDMETIFKEGEERYKKQIPPGYKDSEKDRKDKTGVRKYGDLIIWHQMIDRGKKNKKPIIFVTGEKKEDWWWLEGGRIIGPRPELRKEMKTKAGVDFYMYKMDDFIEQAGKMLSLKIDKKLVTQIRKLIETDRIKEIEEQASEQISGLPIQHIINPEDLGRIFQSETKRIDEMDDIGKTK